MRILISTLIFFQQVAFGLTSPSPNQHELGILNPELVPGKFILNVGNYEDQRFDIDLDGKIDFWRLKNNNVFVDVRFLNSEIDEISIRKINALDVTEVLYVKDGNTLSLSLSQVRPKFIMNFSAGDKCPSSKDSLEKELNNFKDFEKLIKKSSAINLIANECKDTLGSQGYNTLAGSLSKFLQGDDLISKCIERPDFKKIFTPGKETDLNVEVLKTAYALERAKLTKNNEKYAPIISCQKIDERRGSPGLSTTEEGKIKIAVSDSMQGFKVNPEQLNHELLHRVGFYSEASVKKIVHACNDLDKAISVANKEDDKDKQQPCMQIASIKEGQTVVIEQSKSGNAKIEMKKNATSEAAKGGTEVAQVTAKSVTPSKTADRNQSAINAGANTTANIPKSMTVAQTKIPSSESLSETIYSNHQKNNSGISNAYAKSTSQSSGILATANNIAGAINTPAEASLAKAKNQAREIASATQTNGTTAVSKNGSVGGLISRNKIGSGETVVESITLDSKKPMVARTDGSSSIQNSRLPASDSGILPASETSGSTLKTASLNSTATDSGIAKVNPTGGSQQMSLGTGTQSNQRQPTNVINQGGNNNSRSSANSPDEVITFISQGDYQRTKQRLKDPSFVRQLETYNITVIDTKGNSYGAKQGEVKFLDDEVRFVLQSKK